MLRRPSGAIIPAELLMEILGHLDAEADRQTFLQLMQVSLKFWRLASSVLYRRLSLTKGQLRRLIAGGAKHLSGKQRAVPLQEDDELRECQQFRRQVGHLNLTDRARRCLGFVRHLVLLGPLDTKDFFMLYATTRPHEPLLPNASHLEMRDYDDFWFSQYDWHKMLSPRGGRPAPPRMEERARPSEILFGSVSVCGKEYCGLQCLFITAREMSSITLHASSYKMDRDMIPTQPWTWTRSPFGAPCRMLRVFEDDAGYCLSILGYDPEQRSWDPNYALHLGSPPFEWAQCPAWFERVQVCFGVHGRISDRYAANNEEDGAAEGDAAYTAASPASSAGTTEGDSPAAGGHDGLADDGEGEEDDGMDDFDIEEAVRMKMTAAWQAANSFTVAFGRYGDPAPRGALRAPSVVSIEASKVF